MATTMERIERLELELRNRTERLERLEEWRLAHQKRFDAIDEAVRLHLGLTGALDQILAKTPRGGGS